MRKIIFYIIFTVLFSVWNLYSWYDADWGYRRKITINSNSVFGTLTNFPYLVAFTNDSELSNLVGKSDGSDIMFVNHTDSNKLSYEREYYTNGDFFAWVKVPLLADQSNTVIYMYFGNPLASEQQDRSNTWDSDYLLTLHMSEKGSGTRYDSTTNAHHCTPANYEGDEATNGIVAGGDYFDGSDYLDMPLLGTTSNMSLEIWVNINSLPNTFNSLFHNDGWEGYDIHTRIRDNGTVDLGINGNTPTDRSSSYTFGPADYGIWQHIVFTYSASSNFLRFYINGTFDSEVSYTATGPVTIGAGQLGDWDGGNRSFNGIFDEIRVSRKVRSTDWYKTSYTNQFLLYDSATQSNIEAPGDMVIINPLNGSYYSGVTIMTGYTIAGGSTVEDVFISNSMDPVWAATGYSGSNWWTNVDTASFADGAVTFCFMSTNASGTTNGFPERSFYVDNSDPYGQQTNYLNRWLPLDTNLTLAGTNYDSVS
ncbi:MAG TPA: DUF2341 domain-containing protein, partial [Spirochaetota bacterium]|nr:DUF2341 domain-containing protein [Spirochaetota bacterium]